MKNKSFTLSRRVWIATVALLMHFVVFLFSSCSPDNLPLCKVNIETSNNSRDLQAIVGSSDISGDFNIYYKSIYKGSGSSYGDMSKTSEYQLLDQNGILVSQGLWEIQVILTNKSTDPSVENPKTITKTENSSYIEGTSGDIFINLNTTTIRVAIGTGGEDGYFDFVYSVQNITNCNLSLTLYKYEDEKFASEGISITTTKNQITDINNNTIDGRYKYLLTTPVELPSGVYYVVLEMSGTRTGSNNNEVIYLVDSLGLVIREGVTTKLTGSYHYGMSNNGIFDVTEDVTEDNHADIKEWGGNEFSDGGIYKIIDDSYSFVCSDPLNRNKILEEKDVKIDLNGNELINFFPGANKDARISKTYFTVSSGSALSIINTGESASTYGFDYSLITGNGMNDNKRRSLAYPSFIVDSGKLNIGNMDTISHIKISGCPNIVKPADGMYRHAAIDITDKGGTVNLYGGEGTSYPGVCIKDAVRGISTMDSAINNSSTFAVSSELNVTINMTNASIVTTGTSAMDNYGINLDGKVIDGKNKSGKIIINIGGKDNDIYSSASILSSGSSGNTYSNYGIRIVNFTGDVEINILSGSTINAEKGYAIFIDNNCNSVKINLEESQNGTTSITGKVSIKGSEKVLSTGINTF